MKIICINNEYVLMVRYRFNITAWKTGKKNHLYTVKIVCVAQRETCSLYTVMEVLLMVKMLLQNDNMTTFLLSTWTTLIRSERECWNELSLIVMWLYILYVILVKSKGPLGKLSVYLILFGWSCLIYIGTLSFCMYVVMFLRT